MGTTIDFRPNIITGWDDAFNLVYHAHKLYPDLERVIISRSQEEVLLDAQGRAMIEVKMEIAEWDGLPVGKIDYRLGTIDGYPVVIE